MKDDARAIVDLFETVSLGAPQHAVGFVMWRVMHRYIREVDQVLRPFDLTHLQFTTLTLVAWMARSGETSNQSELARFGDIHPMQVSNLLKALERKKMVQRAPAPGNALAKYIAITPDGVSAIRKVLPLVIGIQDRLFGAEGRPGGSLLNLLVRIDALV